MEKNYDSTNIDSSSKKKRNLSGFFSKEDEPDYSSYIEGYRNRIKKQEEKLRQLREHVLKEAKKIASLLASRYNVDMVVLFGSFAKGTHSMDSDVDIAIQGINSDDYWEAWSLVDRLTDFSIDLRCLEDFPDSSRKLILEQGMILYEQGTTSDADSGD